MRHSYQILKKPLALLCCLAMLMAMLPAAFAAGSGNQANFITSFVTTDYENTSGWTAISSAEELSNVRDNLGGKFYLTQDIDLSGMEWTPIGTEMWPFYGFFSGNGYVIRNLTISGRNGLSDFGLFGGLGGGAQVFDLGLENVNINVNNGTPGGSTDSYVGGLAGYVQNSSGNAVVVQNCYVTGQVNFNSAGEKTAHVGGLIGAASVDYWSTKYNSSFYLNASYNRASVTASGMSCTPSVGGLIGFAGARDEYGRLAVQNCFNSGDVMVYSTNTGGSAGGLLGKNMANSAIVGSYNAGDVHLQGSQGLPDPYRSTFLSGGVVGGSTSSLVVENCYNCGDVSLQSDSTNDCDSISGGIVGEASASTGIANCYNSGDVSAENNYGATRAGGIAGLVNAVLSQYQRKAYITNSFVLSSSVAARGRADELKSALVYTTDERAGGYVDNGFGNVWQEGTYDSVKTNTSVAADDVACTGDANARSRISRDQAKQLGTYTGKGWSAETWTAVQNCDYPQLAWQTEALGYTGSTSSVTPFITFTAKKSSDTYQQAGFVLSDFVNEATYTGSGTAAFTYTLAKDGGAAQTVALSAPVTASGTYTVTAKAEVDGAQGSKSLTFTINKAARTVTAAETNLSLYIGTPAQITVAADNAAGENPTYTYASDNTAVATVGADGTVTPVAEGSAVVTLTAPATANYKEAAVPITVKVTDLPLQEVSFEKEGAQTAVYGDAPITNAAENQSANGGTISYDSSDKTVATVDADGKVTILAAGKTTITATAAGVENTYAPTTVSYELTVAPRAIDAAAAVAEKVYDGTTAAQVTVSFTGLVEGDTLALGDGYTVTASFDDPNVGTGKTVNVSIAVKNGNYTLNNGSIALTDGVITKAAALALPEQNLYVHYEDTAEKTHSVANLMPGQAGDLTYAMGTVDNSAGVLNIYTLRDTPGLFAYSLKAGLSADQADVYATADIAISSRNYNDSTVQVKIHVVNTFVPEVTAPDITVDYTGAAVDGTVIEGTAVYDGETVEGTWAFKAGQSLTSVSDSGPKVLVFTPDDTSKYHPVEVTVVVTIEKADPTGEPGYTPITTTGKTLADAALNVGTIQPEGTISWDDPADTEVTANTEYNWTFTPNDTANYNTLTGKLRPYAVSSGGGGGGTSTNYYQISVSPSENGDVTASTVRAAKGSKVILTVKAGEGYELDTLTVTDYKGGKVDVSAEGENKYAFTMPASIVTVKATFKAVSTEPDFPFTDVPAGSWYEQAVKYVYENGLMNGTGDTVFGPNVTLTRGMLVTILHRLENEPETSASSFPDVAQGQYYTDAVAWASANGIVTGYGNGLFGPDDVITREQMAAILYRYAQYKEYDVTAAADLAGYTDAAEISSYALGAMQWVNAEGIITGTSATTLSPTGSATRAEVATILMRFIEGAAE